MGGTIPALYRDLARQARDQGWTVEPGDGGHLAWRSPSGETVWSAASPSDRWSPKKVAADLRRAGAIIDGRGASERDAGPDPAPLAPDPEPVRQELTELTEMRELLAELKTERQEIARERAELDQVRKDVKRILAEDVTDLVAAEVVRRLEEIDFDALANAVLAVFRKDGNAALDDFAKEQNKLASHVQRQIARILGETADLNLRLKNAYDAWHAAADRGNGIPPRPTASIPAWLRRD